LNVEEKDGPFPVQGQDVRSAAPTIAHDHCMPAPAVHRHGTGLNSLQFAAAMDLCRWPVRAQGAGTNGACRSCPSAACVPCAGMLGCLWFTGDRKDAVHGRARPHGPCLTGRGRRNIVCEHAAQRACAWSSSFDSYRSAGSILRIHICTSNLPFWRPRPLLKTCNPACILYQRSNVTLARHTLRCIERMMKPIPFLLRPEVDRRCHLGFAFQTCT